MSDKGYDDVNNNPKPKRFSRRTKVAAISVVAFAILLFMPILPRPNVSVQDLPDGHKAFVVSLIDTSKIEDHIGSNSTPFMPTSDKVPLHGWVDAVARHADGTIFWESHHTNLITTVGKDWIAPQLGSTSPGGNGANYIALSTNTKAPAASDTCISTTDGGTTSAEITDGNGLARAQGTYAHTGGNSNFTVSKTFSATGTYTAVHRAGLVTGTASGDTCAGGNDGSMIAQTAFSNDVTLVSGDSLAVTWTVNF